MALTDIIFSVNNSVATRGNVGVLTDITSEYASSGYVSPTYKNGYFTVTGTFKSSGNVNLPDNTLINAFHFSTHLKVGSGLLSGGVVTMQVSTSDNVYLVVDPSASGLSGETVCTTLISPS